MTKEEKTKIVKQKLDELYELLEVGKEIELEQGKGCPPFTVSKNTFLGFRDNVDEYDCTQVYIVFNE